MAARNNAGQQWTPGFGVIVGRYNPSGIAPRRRRIAKRGRRIRPGHGGGQQVYKVSILVRKIAVILPAQSQIQRKALIYLEVVLYEPINILCPVTVNDSARPALD